MIVIIVIRPHIDYGSPRVFHNAPKSATIKLDRLQYRCIRQCLGALKSSPTNSPLSEAREMPLETRRQLLTDNYLLKKLTMNDQTVLKPIISIHNLIQTRRPNKPESSFIKSFNYINQFNLKIYPKHQLFPSTLIFKHLFRKYFICLILRTIPISTSFLWITLTKDFEMN